MIEEELAGGGVTPVVRVGATVRRATGPYTVAVHALLRHLDGCAAPRVYGYDERGREIVDYLPGEVVHDERRFTDWTGRGGLPR